MTRVEQYQGYQVKTPPALGRRRPRADLVEDAAAGGVVVKGAQIFTVHHSPYTLKFFENVPFEDLQETIGGVRYALVGRRRDREHLAAVHLPPRGRRTIGSRSITATASP